MRYGSASRRVLVLAAVFPLLALTVASANATPVQGLAFVEVQQDGVGGVDGLGDAACATVSPDGAHVYAVGNEALAAFRRDSASGALTFVEKKVDGLDGVDGLAGANWVALSPDGTNVYVTGRADNAVAVFSRDATTGRLTFVEVQRDGVGGVDGLGGASGAVITPDGAHAYVAGFTDNAVAVFSRNAGTGALTFVEVQQDGVGGVDGLAGAARLAVSADGTHLYVPGFNESAVAVFSVNPITGALTFVEVQRDGVGGVDGLGGAGAAVVAPDGAHVYVTGATDNAIAVFTRNVTTGQLSYVGNVQDGVGGVDGLAGANDVAISPDGTVIYASGFTDKAVAVFKRNTSTGALSFLEVERDRARGVEGLQLATSVAASPDGRHVYATGGFPGAVVVFQTVAVRCSPTLLGGCRQPTQSQRALLTVKDNSPDTKDSLVWKWLSGAATGLPDLGDPASTTDYALCLYDASGSSQPLLSAVAPADGLCAGGRACWRALGAAGFRYKDRQRAPDGLLRMALTPGGTGAARIVAKGTGTNLATPLLPLTPPVRVQLSNSDGQCWTATYSTAAVNDGVTFRAVAD